MGAATVTKESVEFTSPPGKPVEVSRLELLTTVRERAEIVYSAAKSGKLNYFDFDKSRMTDVADYVLETIKVN
jgi:hypothetical protein